MSDNTTVKQMVIDGVLCDVEDTTARAMLKTKLDAPPTTGEVGQILTQGDNGPRWTDNQGGLSYIYVKTPKESDVDINDILTVTIELSDNDSFGTVKTYTHKDCQLFNPATGLWIDCPAEGIDIAMTDSVLRFTPDVVYNNCRYRWAANGVEGSWNV